MSGVNDRQVVWERKLLRAFDRARKAVRSAPSTPRTWFELLNQPFAVTFVGGGLIFLISTCIQDRYWVKQQRYTAQQAYISKRIDAATTAEAEIINGAGKLISAYALLVGAHENQIDDETLELERQAFNKEHREWDDSRDLLNLKMNRYFLGNAQQHWESLNAQLPNLDQHISILFKMDTRDQSTPHHEKMRECRVLVSKAEDEIYAMGLAMDAAVQKSIDDVH